MTEVEFGLKLPYIRQFLVFGSLLISASKPNIPPLPVDQPAPLRLLVLQLHLGHHASGSILVSRCSTSTTDIRAFTCASPLHPFSSSRAPPSLRLLLSPHSHWLRLSPPAPCLHLGCSSPRLHLGLLVLQCRPVSPPGSPPLLKFNLMTPLWLLPALVPSWVTIF